ncbi:hypothetical protein [Arcobacter sp. YIC-310]|uniref:hypothetical protein n=1 Tax=Arcobacter sp. YIC-310 TaxID=3376632 RepID=UPI003C29C3C7
MKKALGNPKKHPMETTIKPGYKKGLHVVNQVSGALVVMHSIESTPFSPESLFWEVTNFSSEVLLYIAGEKGILQQVSDTIKNNAIDTMNEDRKTIGYFMKEVLK